MPTSDIKLFDFKVRLKHLCKWIAYIMYINFN